MAIAYYGAQISPHMTETPEGYLICRDVPINRTGQQEYLARDLQLDGDPEQPVIVNRYPEDVFDSAAMASFEGKDVTAGHPPENLTPENHGAYSKGHIENVRRVGDQTVADLHIKDAALISDIRNGVVREVSCGYLCNYEPDGNGYKQTHIRGNHVAVVPKGRAGHDIAIHDAAAEPAEILSAQKEAEKGRKQMSKFAKAILSAFGMAAKDASPEEMDGLVATAVTALDAEPAEPENKPAPEAAPAEDEMVEKAPKGDDLGSKLDRIIEMLEAKSRGGHGEKPLHDEKDLDEMIEKLSGEKEGDPEAAVTIEESEDAKCMTGDANDAASLLKRVRPAVAAISDKNERARVVDALISAVDGKNTVGLIMNAAAENARKAVKDSAATPFDVICKEQKSAYDARNPHKKDK